MTSEAPKEIWAWPSNDGGWQAAYATCLNDPTSASYTLTTHAKAMVAAERDACAAVAKEIADQFVGYMSRIERSIRARTPADEKAALDALLRAERVKALREAARLMQPPSYVDSGFAGYWSGVHEYRSKILALIEKETVLKPALADAGEAG